MSILLGILQWMEELQFSTASRHQEGCEPLLENSSQLIGPDGDSTSTKLTVPASTVSIRSLTNSQRMITILCALIISLAFYFEIPEFSKALTGFNNCDLFSHVTD
jgi:hypothetical protein